MIEFEKVIEKLQPTLDKIKSFDEYKSQLKNKALIYHESKQLYIINSKLSTIFSNYYENPIMDDLRADDYYFYDKKALEHLSSRYQLIMDIKDYIVEETGLPFNYEKYTVLKIMQLSLNTYNRIYLECQNNAKIERLANIFLDIETMILNDRNTSAENGIKNFKAVDSVNKYNRKTGGYGIRTEELDPTPTETTITLGSGSYEENKRRIDNYGFSKMLENSNNNNVIVAEYTENQPKKKGRTKKNEN